MNKQEKIDLKAPWKVDTVVYTDYVNTFIVDAVGVRLAEVFVNEPIKEDTLAAAPRLLEACEAVVDSIKMTGGEVPSYLTNAIQDAKGKK